MAENTNNLLNRVREIMPEFDIAEYQINQDGLINDILIVNKKVVFRFAKTEKYAEYMDIELNILDLVRGRLGVDVPTPSYREKGVAVYPFLIGEPLNREDILKASPDIQAQLAKQLGTFLLGLHTTAISNAGWEIPSTMAPVTRVRWLDIQGRIKEKIYPLLLKHQIQWVDNLFASVLDDPQTFEYPKALIHGDLASYHILHDPKEGRITGVIDFGVAGVGDAASDIGSLIVTYGESFVSKMAAGYPGIEKFMKRARFYAQSIELQWVLLGLESGENFWFTAHIGNARDVYG
jgi:aminoglycoside 2''-phosphotransferase